MGVQIFQMSTLEKSSENICEFLFFRLRTHFLLFGVVSSTGAFSKKRFILPRGFLWDQSWLEETPPTGFFVIFSPFFVIFFPKNNTHILEELRYFCAKFHNFSMKILEETRVQSLTFLALFFRKRIVHCVQNETKIFWLQRAQCYICQIRDI